MCSGRKAESYLVGKVLSFTAHDGLQGSNRRRFGHSHTDIRRLRQEHLSLVAHSAGELRLHII